MIFLTILLAIFIFGILILVHELGHFWAARAFNVKVTDFAIGMGPAIWKKQKGETLYAIRAIPIGGYCKMEGEDEEIKSDRSLAAKPWWARFIVLFSGAFMNIVLGFVVCLIIVVWLAISPADSETIFGGLSMRLAENSNIFYILRLAFEMTLASVRVVFQSIGMLLSGEAGINDLMGPVGIVDEIGYYARVGGLPVLWLSAVMAVNLGILNLLPLPALDGGRIIFVLIEAVRRKPIPPEKEGIVHFIGIVLLLGLMVFVTFNDIVRLCFGG